MPSKRSIRSPRPIGLVLAVFFAAYGIYMWFHSEHPFYAASLITLSLIWLLLVVIHRREDGPPS